MIVAVGLAGLVAAGVLEQYVAKARPNQGTDSALAAPLNASPLVVFTTVALGGFRGLAIDLLWARVSILQEEGDYVEIAQLSDWITKLNPRLPVVWDYHSFNMAYNISAMSSSPQDRWRWITRGICMLRDEAIACNPHSVDLYDRLCRIYKHKLVDRVDPGRSYYRAAWAEEMTNLHEYKLDPKVMKEVDGIYGPLDWRLPEAHIIYWATIGIRECGGRTNVPLNNMICEAMSESFFNGRIVDFRPSDGILLTDIRDDLLSKALLTFETTARRNGFSLVEEDGFGGFYRAFLRHAVVDLADRQLHEPANALFRILRDQLHDRGSDRPFNEYVVALKSPPPPAENPPKREP